jgi:hypothetical protein
MDDKVPESAEVLQQALTDPSLQGWNETSTDPMFQFQTYWWIRVGDLYLGVLPHGWTGADGHFWFVGQGRNGDPDLDSVHLTTGLEVTPEAAREAAAGWYNRNRNSIKPRS